MRKFILLLFLLSGFCAAAETWFESGSPLNQAHQKLLDNDLEGSFASIIQVWQTEPDKYIENHLNKVFLQLLKSDCGKSISNEPVATWIRNIVVKRQSVQSPGRRISRAVVEIISDVEVTNVQLVRWPDAVISTEANLETVSGDVTNTVTMTYELNQRMESGLYRLEISNEQQETWSQWIVMGESSAREVVRWDSKDTWAVDKLARLNPYCSLPVLTVSLYDYVENEYIRVWHQQYESDYPIKLPNNNLKAGRYVLAVGITHQRWQGSVVLEDQQVISKTYDISTE